MMTRAWSRRSVVAVVLATLTSFTAGCFGPSPSRGGGQTSFKGPRYVNPGDVALPRGYRIAAVARDLTFPTGVAFDPDGGVYVVEAGYSWGEKWTTPRLLRIEPNGAKTEIARGDNPPWNGVDYRNGFFYIAEGGHRDGGRIIRVAPNPAGAGANEPAAPEVLVDNLPSVGDHHTNGPVAGNDGYIYFGQGTATNSGVVGRDNAEMGWLRRHPAFHDIPAQDVTLAGHNFRSGGDETGAFLPFGTPSFEGQVIKGQTLCTGAVLRVRAEGGDPEVVAWGMRNPFGLAFSPGGTLFVTENSYDVRGSRPVWGAGDLLWEVNVGDRGKWYGWPDFHGATPLTKSDHYGAPFRERAPKFLLARHPNAPPEAVAKFGVHSSANGMDFSRGAAFGYEGQAFVALFGDIAPMVGKVISPVGFKVARVDVNNGTIETFATNRGKGPASRLRRGGLERPTAAKFSPDGSALYVVDFGVMTMTKNGPVPRERTGVLWRITREGAR